jgi:hypothetical protein
VLAVDAALAAHLRYALRRHRAEMRRMSVGLPHGFDDLRATPRERDAMIRTARRSAQHVASNANRSRMTEAELRRLFPWLHAAVVSARMRSAAKAPSARAVRSRPGWEQATSAIRR